MRIASSAFALGLLTLVSGSVPVAGTATRQADHPRATRITWQDVASVHTRLEARGRGEMRVLAHVSPDHGWPVLRDFLERTRRRLVVGMFDVGAPHIVAALVALGRKRFERLTMVLQRGSSEGARRRFNSH